MLSIHTKLYQNLLALIAIVLCSIVLITVVGFFDEGHSRIYGTFSNYMSQAAYPPLSDYLLWTFIFVPLGLMTFNLISAISQYKSSLSRRIFLSIFSIPVIFIMIVLGITVGVKLF